MLGPEWSGKRTIFRPYFILDFGAGKVGAGRTSGNPRKSNRSKQANSTSYT